MSRDHADKAKRLEGARRSQQPCEVWDSVGLHEECIMPHRPGSRAESSVSISVSSALMPMAMMKRLVVVVSAAAAVSQRSRSLKAERPSPFAKPGGELCLRTAGRKLVRWNLRMPP